MQNAPIVGNVFSFSTEEETFTSTRSSKWDEGRAPCNANGSTFISNLF